MFIIWLLEQIEQLRLILVRSVSYGPQIDQSHGENRLSHIISTFI